MNAREKYLYGYIRLLHVNIRYLKDFCITNNLPDYFSKLIDFTRLFEHKIILSLVDGDYDCLTQELLRLTDMFDGLYAEIHNSVHMYNWFDPDANQD